MMSGTTPKIRRNHSTPAFTRQISANSVEDKTQLASALFHSGHSKSALKILEDELKTDKQIETLLEWSATTPAFIKALETGNPDLIYMVMLKLPENMKPDDFQRTIRNFPIAVTLYKKYCYQFNRQKLYEMYVQENDFCAQAMTFISNSLEEKELHKKESLLSSASRAYSSGRNTFNSLLCEEQLKLITYQKQLNEKILTHNFIGKTVQETCSLLLRSDPKMAEEFRDEFKIPEKRFWLLKVQSLAETENWQGLEKLSKIKKCPIGGDKFVEACLEKNNKEEALKYLPTVREKFKIKYYIKMGFLEEAADMAFKRNDHYTLLLIKSLCKYPSELVERVKSMIMQLDKANCHIWHSFSL